MIKKRKNCIISCIILSVVLLAVSVIPAFAVDDSASDKLMSWGFRGWGDCVHGDYLMKLSVFFTDPPSNGTNTIKNHEYINVMDDLIENVDYVSENYPYALITVKASNVISVAEFDFVRVVYQYEAVRFYNEQSLPVDKLSHEIIKTLDEVSVITDMEIDVLFYDPPTHEKDMEERTAEMFEEYYAGNILIDEDDDPGIAIRRMANADVYTRSNNEYISRLGELVEKVDFVDRYYSHAQITLKASDIITVAGFDFVESIHKFAEQEAYNLEEANSEEETTCSYYDGVSDDPYVVEYPLRIEDMTNEGFPQDFRRDGKTWVCTDDITPGDVNRDGRITSVDARLALRASAKLWTPFVLYQFYQADVDNDKKITSSDARAILRASAKLEQLQ